MTILDAVICAGICVALAVAAYIAAYIVCVVCVALALAVYVVGDRRTCMYVGGGYEAGVPLDTPCEVLS